MFRSFALVKNKFKLSLIIALAALASLAESFGIAAFFPLLTIIFDSSSESFVKDFVKDYLKIENVEFALTIFIATIFLLSGALKLFAYRVIYQFIFQREAELGVEFFRENLYQPYYLLSKASKSKTVSKILGEVGFIINGSLMPAILLIVQFLSVGFLLITLLITSSLSGYIGLVLIILLYLGVYFVIKPILLNAGKTRVKATETKFSIIDEINLNPKFIKVKNLEERYLEDFRSFSLVFSLANAKAILAGIAPRIIVEAVILSVGAILLYYFSLDNPNLLNEIFISGGVTALVLYKIFPSLQNIYKYISQIDYNKKSLDEFLEFFQKNKNLKSVTEENLKGMTLKKNLTIESIHFSNISYSHGKEKLISNFSRTFNKGDFVAIIGETGSGKTTLVDLMLGLFEESNGTIKFNNTVHNSYERLMIASQFGLVTQESHLLATSIKENLLIGNQINENVEDRIEKAIEAAEIDSFINSLDDGVDTKVGDGGLVISGGQKQRIAIARSIISEPEVLIFDEGTSALDTSIQSKILKNLKRIFSEKIILFITHNSEVIQQANVLVDLNEMKSRNENS